MADTDLLDYSGLKSYDSKIKLFMHNRQMTKSAPSVQFYPAPESELEPIVDFLFTETPPAEGEKGPDNPSTIAGVSSVSVSVGESEDDAGATEYTISLGDTYYGGSVNFKTGVMTVTWNGVAMKDLSSAVATWYSHSDGTHAYVFYVGSTSGVPEGDISSAAVRAAWVCTHFRYSASSGVNYFAPASTSSALYVQLEDSLLDLSGAADPSNPTNAELVAAINALATSENWRLVYPLAAPTTVQITPTQVLSLAQSDPYTPQINTVFTDQQGVRVGWQRIDIDSILARLDAIEAQLDG